jgi:hypothetical protein
MSEKLPTYQETMKKLPRPPQYKSVESLFEQEVLPSVPTIIPTNPNFMGFLRTPSGMTLVAPSAPPIPQTQPSAPPVPQTTTQRLRRMFNLPN